MREIADYVEASLALTCAENNLKTYLEDMIGLKPNRIRDISLCNLDKGTEVVQLLSIRLIGENHFRAEELAEIKGLTIITPNTLEIEWGEIHL